MNAGTGGRGALLVLGSVEIKPGSLASPACGRQARDDTRTQDIAGYGLKPGKRERSAREGLLSSWIFGHFELWRCENVSGCGKEEPGNVLF
jgi:hypothetical protein